MKYEDWIKYEEARLRNKPRPSNQHTTRLNGRALSSITLDEMLGLLRSWISAQSASSVHKLEPSSNTHNLAGSARAL